MRRAPLVLAAILLVLGLVTTARAKPPSWDTVKPGGSRFKVLSAFNNEAVLDKETGLVWRKSAIGLRTPTTRGPYNHVSQQEPETAVAGASHASEFGPF